MTFAGFEDPEIFWLLNSTDFTTVQRDEFRRENSRSKRISGVISHVEYTEDKVPDNLGRSWKFLIGAEVGVCVATTLDRMGLVFWRIKINLNYLFLLKIMSHFQQVQVTTALNTAELSMTLNILAITPIPSNVIYQIAGSKIAEVHHSQPCNGTLTTCDRQEF